MKMLKKIISYIDMIPTIQYFNSLKKVKISGYTLLGKWKVWDGRQGEAILIDDFKTAKSNKKITRKKKVCYNKEDNVLVKKYIV